MKPINLYNFEAIRTGMDLKYIEQNPLSKRSFPTGVYKYPKLSFLMGEKRPHLCYIHKN